MAYDPLNFFNNGTLVGVAGNVNAPGGQGVWVIANGVASYYPPNSTAYIPGVGITITGTAPVLTIANAGVVELAQGTIAAAGTIDIGANLTLNAGGTLSGSAGGGGGQTFASGQGISFSGTSPDFTINNEGVLELIQGATTATGNITVGSNLTLSGNTLTGPAGGSGTIGVEVGGTLYPTLAAGTDISLTGSGATLTIAAVGGAGTIGVEYAGTLYPTLAPGLDTTFSGAGAVLTLGSTAPTYHDVTSSRAYNTTYTNSTGKQMFVMISVNNGGAGFTINPTVNGVQIGTICGGNQQINQEISFWVSPGDTYNLVQSGGTYSINNWVERY
jgi:hypothetical protein